MAINKVGTKGIVDGSVAQADFKDGDITSAKLGDGQVTNAKLTNSSVTLAGQSISLGGSVDLNVTDWQSVITADGSTNTTAVSGQGYFIDTTSATHTINLPASANRGDFVAIKDYAGTFATNNLTIGRNGHNIQGVANDSLISTNRASLVLVYVDSTKGWLYWEEHNVADLENIAYISATGGTVTTSGDYKIHTFTGDGCFVVSQAPLGPAPGVDYLVVAGGGGGGPGCNHSGGGGAGGYRESSGTSTGCYTISPLGTCVVALPVSATTYPITVGGGGAINSNGSNSIFSTITSTGGGRGQRTANSGGSGGGAGMKIGDSPATPYVLTGAAGNTPPVSPPQGNPGGDSISSLLYSPNLDLGAGGGGGGATSSGSNAPSSTQGGTGGNGATSSITGSPVTRAGGGGGGGGSCDSQGPAPDVTGGAGGPGGGGAGATSNPGPKTGSSGTSNTGSGGGGGAYRFSNSPRIGPGGAGGKGIVILRYKFQ